MMGTILIPTTILTFVGEALAKVGLTQLHIHQEFGLAITHLGQSR
jgi:hypothetical protein